ncbi:MAG: ABC transporter permease, partial [Alicyclobacillus sp.]|nr:ABC transporter permease [Alicyclobacillus sp.]
LEDWKDWIEGWDGGPTKEGWAGRRDIFMDFNVRPSDYQQVGEYDGLKGGVEVVQNEVDPGLATVENTTVTEIRKTGARRWWTARGGYGMLLIFIALCMVFGLIQPNFLSLDNVRNILLQAPPLLLLAFGETFPVLTGGFDLSVGSMVSAASVVTAMVDMQAGLGPGLLAGICTGAVMGLLNGLGVAVLRINPFVVTLGMLSFASGFALYITGGLPIQNLPNSFSYLGTGYVGTVPVAAVVAFIVFLLLWFVLEKTPWGRYTYAVGGNEEAARASGIAVRRYITVAYIMSGGLAACAGILLSSRVASGLPTLGVGMELDAIAAVVIGGVSLRGGVGRMPGVVLGALILTVIQNGLDLANISSFVQEMVTGVIIVAAVLFDRLQRR